MKNCNECVKFNLVCAGEKEDKCSGFLPGPKSILVTYRMKDDTEEITKDFATIEEARHFYDHLYDEMLLFAIITDSEGNVYEEKYY